MTFNNILKGLDYDCLPEGAIENTCDIFIRRTNNEFISDEDFLSNYECNIPCRNNGRRYEFMHRGVSLDLASDEDLVLRTYKAFISFKPKLLNKYKYICKIKLKRGAGLIWKTPNKDNPVHCTFFKCDSFELKRVEILSTHRISEYVSN